ncbi:hypothetical protein R9C00_11080 [Flammeovirgaceae bacterium SG7u.111]|nr:hypothetical protein [Flammeovirgaceae bacterium SG7u.132]WPO37994.1 hypothetical protein R9C00_11080 [Flammeovirgaceae bacterium SG7u.111]
MKEYNIVETIRLFVMQAQTSKAIDELYQFCSEHNLTEFIDNLVLLSSNLAEIKNSEILGLGSYVEEKNRINLALLQMIKKLDQQLANQEKLLSSATKQNESLGLVESKVDFIMRHIEINDDIAYYSFSKSKLWNLLEPSSQDDFINAHIIEKEANQELYAKAIILYLHPILTELDSKFFSKFKASIAKEELDRQTIIKEFKGNNKNNLYKYLCEDYELSLNQMAEILLTNVLKVEKDNLDNYALQFYTLFHKTYKIKSKRRLVAFLEGQVIFNMKAVNAFIQTLVDVIEAKDKAVNFFLNLQPR